MIRIPFYYKFVYTIIIKPSEEQNGRKIVTLLSTGSLSTLILTVSFIQNISF